jgi:hypothetical protein
VGGDDEADGGGEEGQGDEVLERVGHPLLGSREGEGGGGGGTWATVRLSSRETVAGFGSSFFSIFGTSFFLIFVATFFFIFLDDSYTDMLSTNILLLQICISLTGAFVFL